MIGVWRVWRTTIVTAIGAVALLNAPCADAQEKWPSRPVTLVVPVGAGTITDVAGRLLADHLKDIFGQPFVVENKAGAGATLGARYVARAQPDGYTLLVGGNTTHSAVPSLFKSAPYQLATGVISKPATFFTTLPPPRTTSPRPVTNSTPSSRSRGNPKLEESGPADAVATVAPMVPSSDPYGSSGSH